MPILLITRPKNDAVRLARAVTLAMGIPVQVVIAPLMRIVPVAVAGLTDLAHVIFTSANGVAQADDVPRSAVAWCVGTRTAAAAKEAGFVVKVGGGDAGQLLELLLDAAPQGKIAHIRGKHARGGIAEGLNAAGIDCIDAVAYDQVAEPLNDVALDVLRGDVPIVAPLFSPRTAALLMKNVPSGAPLHVVAMSGAVADVVGPITVTVAEKPEGAAMVAAICHVLQLQNSSPRLA